MQLTKYAHSCVRLDDGGRTLVLDPGIFSDAAGALRGADAALITHVHTDHFDIAALRSAAAANPALVVYAPAAVIAELADLGERAITVGAGESLEMAGFSVQTFGGQHAVIYPQLPPVANIGCLINGSLYHPGDSFAVPSVAVSTLLVPIHAPWSKISEVIDFMRAVEPAQAFQIHDALLNDNGLGLVERLITQLSNTEYRHLAPLATVEL